MIHRALPGRLDGRLIGLRGRSLGLRTILLWARFSESRRRGV